MNVTEFKKLPAMGILRGVEADIIEPLAECVVSSGLRTLEITMNTPYAPDLIQKMIDAADGCLTIGAGTILNLDDLHEALNAGASFIVSPVFSVLCLAITKHLYTYRFAFKGSHHGNDTH